MDFDELFDCEVTEADGVYTVGIAPKDGNRIVTCENKYDAMTLKVRKVDLPRIGSRKTINDKNVKVLGIETDSNASVWVLGEGGHKEKLA